MSHTWPRDRHFFLHGPMEGDRLQLADTNLWIEVERNLIEHGEEYTMGLGRNGRDGLAIQTKRVKRDSALDSLVVGAVVMDPVLGILKADLGIKDGQIVGIGQAGNPDMQNGVDLIVDSETMILTGWGLLATPGAIECHAHFLNGALGEVWARHGYTTIIGGSPGLAFDLGMAPRRTFEVQVEGMAQWPFNVALLGRGSASLPALERQLEFGCSGFKIHEDIGPWPEVIDACLRVSDTYDVQTIIHTDSINESLTFQETMAAIAGRTIHMYHVEGAGGGHVPDQLECVSYPNVLPSSTNPTNPYTEASLRDQFEMVMVCHLGRRWLAEDVAFAQSRVRPSTQMAEDWLQDLGAISIMGADTVGMGYAAETVRRTWQLADKMKHVLGETTEHDNERVLRYLAKYTINPARAHGIADYVGSLQPGRLADIVLWDPRFFGVKPFMIIKSGHVTYNALGPGNGSSIVSQPIKLRPQWPAMGKVPSQLRYIFSSEVGCEDAKARGLFYAKQMLSTRNTRTLRKRDMTRNAALPEVRVDPETYRVTADGRDLTIEPSKTVPLNRRYFLL